MTLEQINKLPKWAQSEFKTMSNKIEKLEKENIYLKNGLTKTKVSFKADWDGESIYLPEDKSIRFQLDDFGNRYMDVSLEEDKGTGQLQLHVCASDCISMQCNYANTLDIKTRK